MRLFLLLFVVNFCVHAGPIHFAAEKHLKNVRQLTFGGFNLQPRFSPDGRYISYIAAGQEYGSKCLQVYRLDLCKPEQPAFRVSVGFGEYSSSAFYPDNQRQLLTSNFHNYLPLGNKSVDEICSRRPLNLESILNLKHSDPFFDLDLFEVNNYGNIRRRLTSTNNYKESTISSDGQWIAFMERKNLTDNLFLLSLDGTQLRKLTKNEGHKGSPVFSPDNSRILFDAEKFDGNTSVHSVEIFLFNLKEKKLRQVTDLGGQNVYPGYHSNGRQFFFSSNFNKNSSTRSNIYIVDESGDNAEKITFNDNGFDTFPSFSLNGSKFVWASTRNSSNGINLFIADYVDNPSDEPENDNLSCPQQKQLPNSSKHFLKQLKPVKGLHFPGEKHLYNVRQLTFGGANAEGYFSFDNNKIVLQAAGKDRYGTECDQIYTLRIDEQVDANTQLQRLSSGIGAHTCSYYFPDDKLSIHASTFASETAENIESTCPPKKCQSVQAKTDPLLKKLCNTSYTWDLHPEYDIYKVNEYGNIVSRLTNTYGYDAEIGAVSPDGQWIVFTSMRTGDPELWLMAADGKNVRQLTNEIGYDGGPFFSPDGTKIIFRASRPKPGDELKKYKQLLSYNLVEPLAMELYTINVDGTGMRKITNLGGSNWAPFYLDNNQQIVFSTNFNATGHFGAFDLYLIGEDGQGLERVTYNQGGFDAFPMMSRDGRRFVWGSSRNGKGPMDLNLFLADWIN